MPGLEDLMARGDAASGMMRDSGPMAGPAGPDSAGEEASEGADIEGALAQLESALDGMSPKLADECRTHINAIRDIISQEAPPDMEESADGPPPEDAGGPPPQPPSDMAKQLGPMG
jgi:hypothetical protein